MGVLFITSSTKKSRQVFQTSRNFQNYKVILKGYFYLVIIIFININNDTY